MIATVRLSNRAAVTKPTRKLQPRRVCAAELALLRMLLSLPIAAEDREIGRAGVIGKTSCWPRRTDRTPSFQEPFTDRNPWVRTSGLSLLEESQNQAADVATKVC